MSKPENLPRQVRREMERRKRRAARALKKGNVKAAAKLGITMHHRIRLVRGGKVVLDLGGENE